MLRILLILLLSASVSAQSVNAILGDTSWFSVHKEWPQVKDSEQDRISSHLLFVLERLKAQSDPIVVSKARAHMISLLEDYIQQGEFPRNFSHPFAERRPCFIDDDGRLCAVGYLVANSAGLAEAERINDKFRFAFLPEMQDSALRYWQIESGLSGHELAMIQPTYRMRKAIKVMRYYAFYDNETKHYGLRDGQTNNVLIQPKYNSLQVLDNSSFVLGQIGDNWKLLNVEGKTVTRKNFSQITLFGGPKLNRAVATTKKGNLFIYSDSQGLLFKHRNQLLHAVLGNYLVLKKGDSLSLWRGGDEQLLPGQFESIDLLQELADSTALFQVGKNGKLGIYDANGLEISPIEWDYIEVSHGLFVCTKGADKTFVSRDGRHFKYPKTINPSQTHNNEYVILETSSGLGLFNSRSQNWIIPPQFNKLVFNQSSAFYEVQSDNTTAYFDYEGQYIIPPIYQYIRPYDTVFMVQINGKMGLISRGNEAIIPLEFDTLSFGIWAADSDDHTKLLFKTKKQGKLQLWTIDGKEIPLPAGSIDLYSLGSHICLLKNKEGMRVVISKNQKLVFHSEIYVDTAITFGFKGLFYLKNEKWGMYRIPTGSRLGPAAIDPAIYDTIIHNYLTSKDLFIVQQNGLWGMYSYSKNTLVEPIENEFFYPLDLANRDGNTFFRYQGKWHLNKMGERSPPFAEPANLNMNQQYQQQREKLAAYWIKELPQ
jgi:hypothetical protein